VNSPALRQFLEVVAANLALQGQCSEAANVAQLVAVAQAAGFAVTVRELQLWAHHEAFQAPWWPWAGAGPEARTAYCRG
jgi:predicted ribosomally synthesized peptide with nif11-like leader